MSSEDIYRTPDLCFEGLSDFAFNPNYIDDLADFMAGKILSCLNLEHDLYPVWTG